MNALNTSSFGRNLDALKKQGKRVAVDLGLQKAVRAKSPSSLRKLLESGIEPNQIDADSGDSLLTCAVSFGSLESVRALLEFGADPNRLNRVASPLYIAAALGKVDMVTLLLDYEADLEFSDEVGEEKVSGLFTAPSPLKSPVPVFRSDPFIYVSVGRVFYEGKHLPKAIKSRGDPLNRIFR